MKKGSVVKWSLAAPIHNLLISEQILSPTKGLDDNKEDAHHAYTFKFKDEHLAIKQKGHLF